MSLPRDPDRVSRAARKESEMHVSAIVRILLNPRRFVAAAIALMLLAGSDAAAQNRSIRSGCVVCPSEFRDAIEPWVQYRRRQGIAVKVIESDSSAADLRQAIRTALEPDGGFVLLIGDAPVIGMQADVRRHVPMHYVRTTVSGKFGSTPTMATDAPYGDLDGDGLVDVAVGRLPVDTPGQLQKMIDRIKVYESSQDFSFWRNRLQLIGGVGGFGMVADTAIESVTRLMVTASLPVSVRTSVDYGSPGHRFYPRNRFTESVVKRFGEGCRFWVYAGHGQIEKLDEVPRGPSGVPVLDNQSLRGLRCDPANAPIALLLCCYTGAIDAAVDSFAERFVLHDCGPIAVIAGNRVTMPYGNASLALGLIDSVYGKTSRVGDVEPIERPAATHLGQAWLSAIERLQSEGTDGHSQVQTMVNAVATVISPAGFTLADERLEHAALYGLLGDPLLRLHPPQRVHLETRPGFDAGQPIELTVTSPITGRCRIMLDEPLGHVRSDLSKRVRDDPNVVTLAETQVDLVADQPQTVKIALGDDHRGVVVIRTHVAGKDSWAAGGAKTLVRPESK